MKTVLQWISETLEAIGVPYEFEEWTDSIVYPYTVGSFEEAPPLYEDGLENKVFIIDGFTRHEWIELFDIQEKIKQCFPPVEGKTAILDSGSGIAVYYDTSYPIPTGEEGLKKLEIRLQVKFWKVG